MDLLTTFMTTMKDNDEMKSDMVMIFSVLLPLRYPLLYGNVSVVYTLNVESSN